MENSIIEDLPAGRVLDLFRNLNEVQVLFNIKYHKYEDFSKEEREIQNGKYCRPLMSLFDPLV